MKPSGSCKNMEIYIYSEYICYDITKEYLAGDLQGITKNLTKTHLK